MEVTRALETAGKSSEMIVFDDEESSFDKISRMVRT